ncbi:hypothetical protein [Enterococcus bulliens]|uniref:hypothetical protein n=1 Tax=uncultured Enterococcus sp. TaxID=167972 RepID=UPI0026006C2C|nr:hypothetical protein [uncultured Enterococcus sp.]
MRKKQSIFILSLSVLTAFHIVFANFYPRIYGYMNAQDRLTAFLSVSVIIRGLLLILISIAGFTCIRENRRLLPIYLGLFLVNLVLFFFI